ncbi:MAG TPA: hypothetical protein VI685_04690 [Candidatus Angelobacter sp.]
MHASAQNSPECPCLEGDVYYENFESNGLGLDSNYGEVTIFRCRRCGCFWLNYLMEYEHLTAAGRWFRGLITPEVANSLKANDAQQVLEGLEWYFRGGSAFQGKIVKVPSGQLKFWLQ